VSGPPSRADWIVNDDGVSVPRRTKGSVAEGYSDADFTLACRHCGDEWGNATDRELPLGVIHAHFQTYHPEALGPDRRAIQLELLWLGRGPAPKANPT